MSPARGPSQRLAISNCIIALVICTSTSAFVLSHVNTQLYLVCRVPNNEGCLLRHISLEDAKIISKRLNQYSELARNCGFVTPISPSTRNKVFKVKPLHGNGVRKIICDSLRIINNDSELKGIHRIRRQTTRRGSYRGQTQTQFLAIGNGKDDGKAEALSDADSSRASVSGSSGMGQAQSQTMYDPSCDECYRRLNDETESYKRPAEGGRFSPQGISPSRGMPNQGGGGFGYNQVIGPNRDIGNSQRGAVFQPTQGESQSGVGRPNHAGGEFWPKQGYSPSASRVPNQEGGGFEPARGVGPGEGEGYTKEAGRFEPTQGVNYKTNGGSNQGNGLGPSPGVNYKMNGGSNQGNGLGPSPGVNYKTNGGSNQGREFGPSQGIRPSLGNGLDQGGGALIPTQGIGRERESNQGGGFNSMAEMGPVGNARHNQEGVGFGPTQGLNPSAVVGPSKEFVPSDVGGPDQRGGQFRPTQGTGGFNGLSAGGRSNLGHPQGVVPNTVGGNGLVYRPNQNIHPNWPISSGSFKGENGISYYCCAFNSEGQYVPGILNRPYGTSPRPQWETGSGFGGTSNGLARPYNAAIGGGAIDIGRQFSIGTGGGSYGQFSTGSGGSVPQQYAPETSGGQFGTNEAGKQYGTGGGQGGQYTIDGGNIPGRQYGTVEDGGQFGLNSQGRPDTLYGTGSLIGPSRPYNMGAGGGIGTPTSITSGVQYGTAGGPGRPYMPGIGRGPGIESQGADGQYNSGNTRVPGGIYGAEMGGGPGPQYVVGSGGGLTGQYATGTGGEPQVPGQQFSTEGKSVAGSQYGSGIEGSPGVQLQNQYGAETGGRFGIGIGGEPSQPQTTGSGRPGGHFSTGGGGVPGGQYVGTRINGRPGGQYSFGTQDVPGEQYATGEGNGQGGPYNMIAQGGKYDTRPGGGSSKQYDTGGGLDGQYKTRVGAPDGQYDTGAEGGQVGQYYTGTNSGPDPYYNAVTSRGSGDIQPNIADPNSISTTLDDYDSSAQSIVAQKTNETTASATSRGGNDKRHSQTNVQGTFTGTGSFSAQAEISDENKATLSEVEGSIKGAKSSTQGRGRNNLSRTLVQLDSKTGSMQTAAESNSSMLSSSSQVQGGMKGGTADAQARGPGGTSSQAQIGFTPYKEGDKVHETQKIPFVGQGAASVQSGRIGQSQTNLSGNFKYGISYNGAAQAGASLDKDATFPSPLSFNVFNENKNFSTPITDETPTDTITESTEKHIDETLKNSETKYHSHTHSDHHKSQVDTHMSSATTPPVETRRSFHTSYDGNVADYEYTRGKDENSTDDLYPDVGFNGLDTDGTDASDIDQNEYQNYDETETHQSLHSATKKVLNVKQQGSYGGNPQHIVLGSLNGHDAVITQKDSDQPDENRIYQPGEKIPGTGGYTIPIGFTGSVKSVGSKGKISRERDVGSHDLSSQAQTVGLSPDTGKNNYDYPSSYGRKVNPNDLRSLYIDKNTDDNNRYVSVTKSITGDIDSENNKRKQYSHTYFTESSSCGYFTFTCTLVSDRDGKKKVCKPKFPSKLDGTPMRC